MEELLQTADFVSLHVPKRDETKWLISEQEIKLMKKSSFLINSSHSSVVKIPALVAALKKPSSEKKVFGAAFDVISDDEEARSALLECENVLLSPHIGGSTHEAGEAIGNEIVRRFRDFIERGSTLGCLNLPAISLPPNPKACRMTYIHENIPHVLEEINSLLGKQEINVSAQLLGTKGKIGYLMIDADSEISAEVLKKLGHKNYSRPRIC